MWLLELCVFIARSVSTFRDECSQELLVQPNQDVPLRTRRRIRTMRTALFSALVVILFPALVSAQDTKFVYVSEGCTYFSKPLAAGSFDDKSFDPPQLIMGERLEILSET